VGHQDTVELPRFVPTFRVRLGGDCHQFLDCIPIIGFQHSAQGLAVPFDKDILGNSIPSESEFTIAANVKLSSGRELSSRRFDSQYGKISVSLMSSLARSLGMYNTYILIVVAPLVKPPAVCMCKVTSSSRASSNCRVWDSPCGRQASAVAINKERHE